MRQSESGKGGDSNLPVLEKDTVVVEVMKLSFSISN